MTIINMFTVKTTQKILLFVFVLVLCGCGKEKGDVAVAKITLDRNKLTLFKGGTAELSAKVSPEGASDKTLAWSSSNESVVRVNASTGLMEAVGEGTATVTATATQNGVKASCNVVVTSELNILFVGNSFTYDAVWWLPGILHAAGIENINMVYMYFSGRLIRDHVSGYSSSRDYTCYRAEPGASAWVTTEGYSIKDIVDEREWNVVSIQEHTGSSEAWGLTPQRRGVLEQWVNRVSTDQNGRPEFAYIMSQAYGNPDIIPPSKVRAALTNNFASQNAMYFAIAAHGKQVMENTQMDRIVSTGTAIQNLRTSSLNTPLDLTRDGWHLDRGLGFYTASCTVFESLLVPHLPGTTLDGNSFRLSTSNTNPEGDQYTTPVTDDNVPVAIEAARHAVSKPFEVTSMSNR